VCAPKTSTVSIIVDALSGVAIAGANQTICALGTTLAATAPTLGIGTWSLLSGSAVIQSPTLAVTTITNVSPGLIVLSWNTRNGVCASNTDTLRIFVDDLSGSVSAGPSKTICPSTYTMQALQPGKGVGQWSLVAGTGSISNPSSATTIISNLGTGLNLFRWTVANGSCPLKVDSVFITRDAPADSSRAGRDTTISNTSYQLSANQPSAGVGQWELVLGLGTFSDPLSAVSLVKGLGAGDNVLRWKITGSCDYTQSDIRITVLDLALPNAFSPNGDGKNDYFEVPNISLYTKVELTVINRWGSVVFENRNYDNTWNGTNQQNQPLAEDSYFYTIKLDDKTTNGFVILKR
jgi:gliding motility-associated-like protein